MQTTKQKPTEQPKSIGRLLMESKLQTQRELKERAKTDPQFIAIIQRLKDANRK